jgi:hypothetical protein
MKNMHAVCFLWFGQSNLFKSSRQIGGFLYQTTTCRADQSFYIFPLVLLVTVGGRGKATVSAVLYKRLSGGATTRVLGALKFWVVAGFNASMWRRSAVIQIVGLFMGAH